MEAQKLELIDKLSNCLHDATRIEASDIGYLIHKIIHADTLSMETLEEVAKKQISSK